MEKITIEIDAKWREIVRSPLYKVVAALQGVAVTFVPLFLYWCGKGRFPGYEPVIVPACFVVIFLVPFFYYSLGAAVIKELLKE
jgi:hypothetical protein